MATGLDLFARHLCNVMRANPATFRRQVGPVPDSRGPFVLIGTRRPHASGSATASPNRLLRATASVNSI